MLKIIEGDIPITVYQNLRISAGLSAKTDEAAKAGLKNSIHSMMVMSGSEVVGMGRIIGDGGCFCQIVDICVLPDHQGRGIGKFIMQNLMAFIQTQLPESCYISLIADGTASFLYEKYGFKNSYNQVLQLFL